MLRQDLEKEGFEETLGQKDNCSIRKKDTKRKLVKVISENEIKIVSEYVTNSPSEVTGLSDM